MVACFFLNWGGGGGGGTAGKKNKKFTSINFFRPLADMGPVSLFPFYFFIFFYFLSGGGNRLKKKNYKSNCF
jgi:hypothetical protein